ncbi:MAG: aquaporin [Candidatus Puniceispirillales bacterium]
MKKSLLAEFLGTLILVMAVVGSGIMAETLSGGNTGLALLANTIATGATLYVIITLFGGISGAHFNPAVTLVMGLLGRIRPSLAGAYVIVQVLGGITGAWLAHAMFDLEILQLSTNSRSGMAQYLSEVVACAGLLLTILLGLRARAEAIPALVAAYIMAAYWFTASTSFANPAVTIARTLTDTFSGIEYGDTLPFILAQVIGAVLAMKLASVLDEAS